MSRHWGKILAAVAVGAAAGVSLKKVREIKARKEKERLNAIESAVVHNRNYGSRKAYIVGGGLAGLAAAAYLVRDCHFPGKQIVIFESEDRLGGSNDGKGSPEKGYACRGLRLVDRENYENFWELFHTIPSLKRRGKSAAEEILEFSQSHPVRGRARLADGDGNVLNAKSMGFTLQDRMAITRLLMMDERKLDGLTVQDWFKETPHVFETRFWRLWHSTFAMQPWSSLFEFRRCLKRMLPAFGWIDTLEGAVRMPFNQYDSLICPLADYLRKAGVAFREGCQVTDVEFGAGPGVTVKTLYLKRRIEEEESRAGESFVFESVNLAPTDICIVTNGSVSEGTVFGDLDRAALPGRKPSAGRLWEKIAQKKPGMGSPEPFFSKPEETERVSFTVTARGNALLEEFKKFAGGRPEDEARMTFGESPWLVTVAVPVQPYFAGQPEDVAVFWGCGLAARTAGAYVNKAMKDCTGREIVRELLCAMHVPEERQAALMETVINVIPCYMPFAGAPAAPRKFGDRPKVLPTGTVNLAMVGQFVEIPEDMVLTEEYSVRSARMAVYGLMDMKREVCPVTSHGTRPAVVLRALGRAFRPGACAPVRRVPETEDRGENK